MVQVIYILGNLPLLFTCAAMPGELKQTIQLLGSLECRSLEDESFREVSQRTDRAVWYLCFDGGKPKI